jgi:AcrR family transcriptional regulator
LEEGRVAQPASDVDRPVLAALRSRARVETPVRREDGAEVPLGARGARTRMALLAAAYDVFRENGFQNSSVALIAEKAGVGVGTFYQYFRDRTDVLGELVSAGISLMVESGEMTWRLDDGREGLLRMLNRFVGGYAEQAAFWAMWEEVTHTDERLAAVRRDLSRRLEQMVATELRRGRSRRRLKTPTDVNATARALTAMVDRFCYMTYVFDPSDPPMPAGRAARLLTDLWVRAIELDTTEQV